MRFGKTSGFDPVLYWCGNGNWNGDRRERDYCNCSSGLSHVRLSDVLQIMKKDHKDRNLIESG